MGDTVGAKGSGAGQAPPAPSASTVNTLVGVAGALPEYGVRRLVVVAGPHAIGLASSAVAPPLNVSRKSLNGTCGLLANVVVSCPVLGSGVAVPTSRTSTPLAAFATSRKIRYGLPVSGCPM